MSGGLEEAVRASLRAVDLKPEDAGAVELAITYSRQIDDGAEPVKVGPPLLAVLEALGLTPRARAALTKGGNPSAKPGPSTLDELRQRRAARGNGPAAVDSTAS